MRYLQFSLILLVGIAVTAGTADAQRKTRRTATAKKTTTVVPPLEVRAAREKVGNQSENVIRFIDAYGPKAEALELLDRAFETKKVSDATLAKHESNKKAIIQSIRNLRDGLATLESEFRTKPDLKKYLPTIEGITDLTAAAEDSAIAGKFVAAKEPLRNISKKLTDTLAAMPQ